MKITLITIPEPAEGTATVLTTDSDDPKFVFFAGTNDVDIVCGECGHAVAQGLESPDTITSVVFHCPACGAYGATPN